MIDIFINVIISLYKKSLIIGGYDAEVRYPWHAELMYVCDKNGNVVESATKPPYQTTCGASLLSSKTVITAAHCLRRKFLWNCGRVLLGNTDKTKKDGSIISSIDKFFMHEKFATEFHNNYDFGLIILRSHVKFTPTMSPVCIAHDDTETYAYQKALTIGWGMVDTSKREFATKLQTLSVHIMKKEDCCAVADGNPPWCNMTSKARLCASSYHYDGSGCFGDSGWYSYFTTQFLYD